MGATLAAIANHGDWRRLDRFGSCIVFGITFIVLFLFNQSIPIVTAPLDADETSFAYLSNAPPIRFGGRGVNAARRASQSMSASMRRPSASILMRSPSSIRPMGPPTAASGETWPMTKPWDAPENRPSVINATLPARPCPATAGRHGEHFAHARAAFWPFIADDDHIALDNIVRLHRGEGFILRVKDRARPSNAPSL